MLVNPDYYEEIFTNAKIRSAISRGTTPLNLVTLAAPLIKAGHKVRIVDMNIVHDPERFLADSVREFHPHFVGITSTTPLIIKTYAIAKLVKDIDEDITVVAGGPHPSALPEEVLAESRIDCVVKGEGDSVLKSIIEKGINSGVPNIFYKQDDIIGQSDLQSDYIKDLDSLPFPAYEILNIKDYYQPRISSRKAPLAYIETSRGCYGRCIFCNKNINGSKLRMKSPKRVVDEMEHMLKLGFKELQIIDDLFTADMGRAFLVCEEIIRRGLKFSWYPRGGSRVDRVSLELLKIMKKAGCYRIPFGVESGSQRLMDLVEKNISREQVENAVKLAKKVGMETECYFMLGLPTETEEEMNESINFAIRLNPDYAKFAVTIPLPGTRMFDMMSEKGQIKTRDWSKYNFSSSSKEIYNHDNLSWKTIDKYYDISHRRFYFRIGYILHMALKTVMKGTFFDHLKAFLKTRW